MAQFYFRDIKKGKTTGAFTRHSFWVRRSNNIGHGTLEFCRVKANFLARVPKNLGGPRPPREVVSTRLERGPRAETRGNLVPRVFALMTLHESEGSGVENELWDAKILYFSREERWPRKIRRIVA